MVRATLDDIAAKTGSSRSTVARLMASLRKANVVRLEHGGRWMLNPAVVFKGAQPPNECADSLSSDGTTRASLGARRERAEGCLMPIIEMVLPGEPKQQPEHVAEVYRITVERGDGIACSDMEAKTAMSLLCIEMVTNGLKKSRPKRSRKQARKSNEHSNPLRKRQLPARAGREPAAHLANGTPARTELLQRLADEELAQAQHSEWIRAKVAAARADTRPTLTTDEVRASLKARYERLRDASR